MDYGPTSPPNNLLRPAPTSTLQKLFIGKDGLRAGWSLLIFFGFFALLILYLVVIGHGFHLRSSGRAIPAGQISIPPYLLFLEAFPFLATVFITWIMSRIEHRPNSVYGLGGARKLQRFLAGLGWGVVCLSLLIVTLWATGFLVIDRRVLFGGEIFRYGAVWLGGFLMVGLLEEYLSRGYLQYTLTRGLAGFYQWAFKTRHSVALGFWTAAAIVSILFGLSHNHNTGESPIGLLSAGTISAVFCLSLWRTGSLWWAIGFHTAWDWAQSFLYGVPDSGFIVQHKLMATYAIGNPLLSGGATGPEGSIFVVVPVALALLIIVSTLPSTRYGAKPERPDQTGSGRA